jgi:hypothetical protein
MNLRIVPVSLREAQAFVEAHHRHHGAPRGHKFSLGVATDQILVGVAIVGRPISRVIAAERPWTLEVLRTATDGTRNANSALYGAAWRATRALGFERLITYTQEGETGASLRASGFRVLGERPARGGWDMPSRPRRDRGTGGVARTLWERDS